MESVRLPLMFAWHRLNECGFTVTTITLPIYTEPSEAAVNIVDTCCLNSH